MPEPLIASEFLVTWRPDWPAYACPESTDHGHDMVPAADSYTCQRCYSVILIEEAHSWWNWAMATAARESIVRMSGGEFAHMKQMCN